MQEVENQTPTNKLQTAHNTGSVTHGAWVSSAITQPTCNKVYRRELKPYKVWKTILKMISYHGKTQPKLRVWV